MIVHVTEADIESGNMGSCTTCPVALALDRQTGRTWTVSEEEARCIGADGEIEVVDLPRWATSFVQRFDGGFPVHPFEFEIEWEAAHA